MLEHSYFLGIDGGGSKCKARLEDATGRMLGEHTGGPANPMRDYDLAISSIENVISGVFNEAGLPIKTAADTHAVFGLAGLNIPSCMQKMQQWRHPFASLELTTDLRIACVGAHEHSSGAIVIIGTGSSGIVCDGSKHVEFGGHGFVIGDKGSGAWFGEQCLRYTLESMDGIRPSGPLVSELLNRLEQDSAHALVEQYANAAPAEFAKLAPLVFDFAQGNDPIAVHIVEDGADYINKLCTQMFKHTPKRFSFIGGLSRQLIPWLSSDVQQRLSEPLHSPEKGAILIARQQFSLQEV